MTAGTRRQFQRLRFVTARYEALQGLRTSAQGAVLLAAGLVQLLAGLDSLEARTAVFAGAVVAMVVVARVVEPAIGRWYERTYGRVERDDATRRAERVGEVLLLGGFAALSGLAELPHFAPWGFWAAAAGVAAVVAAGNWLRFGGSRMIELALAAVFAVVALLVAGGVWSPADQMATAWFAFGLGLLLAGLLDHLMLARALRAPGPEVEDGGARAV
jgi:hypothetical protein